MGRHDKGDTHTHRQTEREGGGRTAAHGEGGEGVLEDLLEAQELDDGQGDSGVETKAALVGSDSLVELHAVAAVDLDAHNEVSQC